MLLPPGLDLWLFFPPFPPSRCFGGGLGPGRCRRRERGKPAAILGAPCPGKGLGRASACLDSAVLIKTIPTFHPSALQSRRLGGGWREGGRLRRDDPRGPVMVTQWWPDPERPVPLPGGAAGSTAGTSHRSLGFPSLFSIITHHARALHPTRTLFCTSLGVFWGCMCVNGTFWGLYVLGRTS